MIILGVSEGADAGAALVVDGELVAVVAQERVDRVRHSSAFPSGAIDAALDVAGVKAREVDRVVFGTSISGTSLGRQPKNEPTSRLRDAVRGARAALRASGLYIVEQDIARKLHEPRMRALGFERAAVEVLEHDRAHATAAYRCQDDTAVLVLTLDSPAAGAAVTVSTGRHLQLDRLYFQTALASVTTFPDRIAALLKIDPTELWALAAFGSAPADLKTRLSRECATQGDGFTVLGRIPSPDPLVAELSGRSAADVAAAAQEVLEDAVLAWARRWITRTGLGSVAVAGELFACPRLCARLAAEPDVVRLSVLPLPGDEGLAMGAALGASGAAARLLPTLALGPRFTDDQCYRALSVASLPRDKVDDPERAIAERVAAGKTVARFAGPLEAGRATGNRSVFFRGDDPRLRTRALAALRRPEHAPVLATVNAASAPRAASDALVLSGTRFATFALPAHPDLARVTPALVHPDGRVWLHVAEDAAVGRILAEVQRRTGHFAVGQLELRYANEPVVASPGDAIRSWRASEVDTLVLGPYVVER